MASFDELFPDADPRLKEPFSPIQPRALPGFGASVGARVRRALDTGADPAQDSGDIESLLAGVAGLASKKPAAESPSAMDYGRAALAGTASVGTAVVGAGEYAANQLEGKGETPFEQGMGDLRSALGGARRSTEQFATEQVQAMSPVAQQRMMREWTTLDPNKTIWQGDVGEFLSSLSLQVTQAAPSSVVTLLPGALMLRAGMTKGALTYLGASEGAISTGAIASNIDREVMEAPEQELMESQRYQELRAEMGSQEARQALVREAQGYAPVIGGVVVGLIGRQAGKYLEPIFSTAKRGALGRFGAGFRF
ncbi:MAG: hypothetical protein HC794_02925 [Nitrospiraceae bacterium]|nr:hypothetical protein [Nitrospiraceae bacterium]